MTRANLTARRDRGVTLIELLVTVAVTSIVLAGVMGVFLAQQRTYRDGVENRDRQAQTRFGLDNIERAVRQAGFGMDPQLAFDFDFYKCEDASVYPTANCLTATRNATNGPDELVVYGRDPLYSVPATPASPTAGNAWYITGATTNTVTLHLRPGDRMPQGQILQLICVGAAIYTYVTVSQSWSNTGSADIDQPISIYDQVDGDPFRQSAIIGSAQAGGCFSNGGIAYRINRSHFFVASDYTLGSGKASAPRPYLLLDTGTDRNLDTTIDAADLIPVAADVVDMQIAYVMARNFVPTGTTIDLQQAPADANTNGVWFDGPEPEQAELTALVGQAPLAPQLPIERGCGRMPTGLMTAQAFGTFDHPCLFDKALTDPYRHMDYPGNIQSVRISLVSQTASARQDVVGRHFPPGRPADPTRALEDRPAFALEGTSLPDGFAKLLPDKADTRLGYRFMVVQTTVSSLNIFSNGLFMF